MTRKRARMSSSPTIAHALTGNHGSGLQSRGTGCAPALACLLIAFTAVGCKGRSSTDTSASDPHSEAPSAGPNDRSKPTKPAPAPRHREPSEDLNLDPSLDNEKFRTHMVSYVRQVAERSPSAQCPMTLDAKTSWKVVVSAYRQGQKIAKNKAADTNLCAALKTAAEGLVNPTGSEPAGLAGIDLKTVRFRVDLPDRKYSTIEFKDRGLELVHGLVPVRTLDASLLKKRIAEGKEYLFRVIETVNRSEGPTSKAAGKAVGVHKYYYARDDRFEPKLHTIYTASLLFTLLKLRAIDDDPRIDGYLTEGARFLLSMQKMDEGKPGYGGFYYSFDTDKKASEQRLVVGTTSKTIFTLLWLTEVTGDEQYRRAAIRAADWLLTMVKPDGMVRSLIKQKPDGSWVALKKRSLLYSGQVLSALSRTYRATGEGRYIEAADSIAKRIVKDIEKDGCYLGDDYRSPNPISSSWVVLSMFDFYLATDSTMAEKVVTRCSADLSRRQLRNRRDIYRHGRWRGAFSSSGNGWLNEVLSELYLHCVANKRPKCEIYEQPIIEVTRLLMQYTYGPENDFIVKNPAMAHGGVFWNVNDRYVRTDAVCHAMNAYINMLPHIDKIGTDPRNKPDGAAAGTVITIPERPLAKRLRKRGKKRRPEPPEAPPESPDGAMEP